jgi:hypothetical protein
MKEEVEERERETEKHSSMEMMESVDGIDIWNFFEYSNDLTVENSSADLIDS